MKRLGLFFIVLSLGVGLYLGHSSLSYATNGNNANGPIAIRSETKKDGEEREFIIDGKSLSLSSGAIAISDVLSNFFADLSDDDEDDEELTHKEQKQLGVSLGHLGVTIETAKLLNDLAKLKVKKIDDAKVIHETFNHPHLLPSSKEELEKLAKLADKLNAKLMWQAVAARYASLLQTRAVTLLDLEAFAKVLGHRGLSFNENVYSPFAAEVFRQYWLQFKDDKAFRGLLLDKVVSPKIVNLLKVAAKRCRNHPNNFDCFNYYAKPYMKSDIQLRSYWNQHFKKFSRLIPTFATFGVSIGQMLDYGWGEKFGKVFKMPVPGGFFALILKGRPGDFSGLHINDFAALSTMEKAASLKFLNLNDNQISSMPAKIEGLGSLTQLYLNNNQISEMPANIKGLKSLRELYLSNNPISSIPADKWGLPADVKIKI